MLDIRDIFVETMTDRTRGKIASVPVKGFDLLERWTIRRADKISVVSAGFLPYFNERYDDLDLDVFTNGIDEILMEEFPQTLDRQSEELKIVYAGNIGDGQALHRIIPDLAKRLEGVANFKIVGDDGRMQNLQNAGDKIGLPMWRFVHQSHARKSLNCKRTPTFCSFTSMTSLLSGGSFRPSFSNMPRRANCAGRRRRLLLGFYCL